MFVLIWASLLFTLGGNSAHTGENKPSTNSYTVNVSDAGTAEAGLFVILHCSFTTATNFNVTGVMWQKCEPTKNKCDVGDTVVFNSSNKETVPQEFRGRVSLLEPDVKKKNCSIIISNLRESDSGSYRLRIGGETPDNKNNAYSFSEKAAIRVTGLCQKPTVMVPALTARQQTTLTCTAPGLCSGSAPKFTWTWEKKGQKDSDIAGNITDFKTENLTAVTQRHSSTLTFYPKAEHNGTKVTCKVSFTGNVTTEKTMTLNVTYVKEPKISGNTTVKMGDALNLTCSVESFRPSDIIWTKLGSNKSLQIETKPILQNDSGVATLVLSNVTAEDSGQYICTATHVIPDLTAQSEVTVKFFPSILSSSACEVQSEVVTCVCISEGFPLPTIKWPLLENRTKYSVTTTVSDNTVHSTVILTVKHHSNTSVECVSNSDIGEAKVNLMIQPKQTDSNPDLSTHLLTIVKQPQVIFAFLTGILISATICCLATKCHRKKQKRSENLAENLEMVTTQVVPLIEAVEANDETHDHEATEGGADAAGQLAPDSDVEPKDVEYSSLDFSMLKRKSPTEAAETSEITETEYAEIKKETTEERQNDGDKEGEVLEGNKEEDAVTGEDRETEQCMPAEEEGGEDVALYSNVKEIMGQT